MGCKNCVPKNEYIMDYIPNKDLFKAVMYAAKLIREYKMAAPSAIRKAAYCYGVSMKDVAHYLGQRGGRS